MKQTFLSLLALLLCMTAMAQDSLNQTPVRRVAKGIYITGTGNDVRAMSPFTRQPEAAQRFATMINGFNKRVGDSVQVYVMAIPTAAAYYTPSAASSWTQDQASTIEDIYAHLDQNIKSVDVYNALLPHVAEPIYLRTDHHWAPLAAYYASQAFASVAGVKVPQMADMEQRTIHRFVGSMYTFTKDAAVKNAPEDFVYYVPRDSFYHTEMITYKLDKNRRVIGENPWAEKSFFVKYPEGSSQAYCTFMGGDSRTVKVKTNTPGHRRLLILKDSFGNALPPYLFGSFAEVHVLDFRYYRQNIADYVRQQGITDVVFAHNMGHACSAAVASKYTKLYTNK